DQQQLVGAVQHALRWVQAERPRPRALDGSAQPLQRAQDRVLGDVMFFLVFFLIAPIIELYVIFLVGGQIGALNTIALLIVAVLLGAWIIKYSGIRPFGRFSQQVSSGRNPTREIADAVCLLAAGTLLLLPGFI